MFIYSSTSIKEFTKIVNERYDGSKLVDGYAPFCKHIFIKNDFTDATVNVLRITPDNEHLLRCTYEARNDKEVCFILFIFLLINIFNIQICILSCSKMFLFFYFLSASSINTILS